MNNFTPVQQRAIQTWTEQRDALLREIGMYSTELNTLKASTTESGLALADLHKSIAEARGRLAELDALEERYKGSVSLEVAELEARKSRLQSECSSLEEKCRSKEKEYSDLSNLISVLQGAHDTMKDQAAIVNRITGELVQTSQNHISEIKSSLVEIRTISAEVIEKGNENVKQTGIILEKLPKYIFELQRPIPVRRRFSNDGVRPVKEEIKP